MDGIPTVQMAGVRSLSACIERPCKQKKPVAAQCAATGFCIPLWRPKALAGQHPHICLLLDDARDAIAFGVPFLANPDLPRRLEQGLALNTPDESTFYASGAKGYSDYPFTQ